MKLNQALRMLSLAVMLAVAANTVTAQENNDRQRRNRDGQNNEGGGGRGNFGNISPEERAKFFADRIKEQLEITDDAEWKALEPLVTKVNEARLAAFTGGRGFGGFGRGGRGGGQGGGPGAQPSPAAEALQKAIDAKASNNETKAALDKFVADRKAKQAELEKAQAALRKVLTPRQEAIATLNGLL